MTSKGYEIIDRHGRVVPDDDDPVLRDGQTLRVPLHMRDHETLSPQQREVMADKAARLSLDDAARRFGLDDGLALHRPGQRFAIDAAARERVEQARAEGIRDMCDAWKASDAAPPKGEVVGARPGDKCMTDDKRPGHLNARLQCVADEHSQDSAPPRMTMDEMQRVKDEAWLQMCRELEDGWKGPA